MEQGGTEHPIGAHDVGGRPAGEVERDEHDHALWERRVDAMMMLLSKRGLLVVDELRRNIEALGPGAYEKLGYYERWVSGLVAAMRHRQRAVAAHGRGRAARMSDFVVGDAVIVRDAWQPGHVRTPCYIKGHAGTIARVLGPYPNPEELAYRRSGLPKSVLYRVRFKQHDVWPGYAGPADDTLDVELYHHWLEPNP